MTFGTKLHKHSRWQSGPSNLIGSDALPDFHGALTGWFRSGAAWSAPALLDYGAARPVLYAPDGGAGSAVARAASPGLSAGGGGAGGGAAASSSLVINIAWDASVQSAPGGFTAAVCRRPAPWNCISPTGDHQFSVGYGEVNGRALGNGTLGASQSYLSRYSYPTLRNALSADATRRTTPRPRRRCRGPAHCRDLLDGHRPGKGAWPRRGKRPGNGRVRRFFQFVAVRL